MKTVALTAMEAMLTHPNPTFKVVDIFLQVQELMGQEINKNTISALVSGDLLKKGAIERASSPEQKRDVDYRLTDAAAAIFEARKINSEKRVYKKKQGGWSKKTAKASPSPTDLPAEVDSLQLGEAIIVKILHMKKEIIELKHKVTDGIVRHDADIKAFKEQIRGKDCYIRELKADIDRLKEAAQHKGRTMPFSELAVINGAHR